MDKFQVAKDIFAKVFYLERLWNNRGDKWFASDGLTTKQWFLLLMAGSKFENPPGLKELSQAMKTSHQNVKSLALKLQKRGFVELFSDDKDKRVTRIRLKGEADKYFMEQAVDIEKYILALFVDIELADLGVVNQVFDQLLANAESEEKQ